MDPFVFHTKLDLALLLGRKARNTRELAEAMRDIPRASIYFHTHRFLHQHHFLSPEPPNDFAYWITEVVGDDVLAERMSSVDVIQFQNLDDLRNRFVQILDGHLHEARAVQDCPPGQEFHFMASRTFVLRTPYTAGTPAEFIEALQKVSVNSLYYHIFDAKLRLGRGENDFSRWFSDLGLTRLAGEIAALDPYTYTLEGLRNRILTLVKGHDPD